MRLKDIASYAIKVLKEHGIVIQKYEAYSTNSIYLKLDCGVSKSLRISDHNGKKHLNYTYNIVNGTHTKYDYCSYRRRYSSTDRKDVDRMLNIILFERRQKLENIGAQQYRNQMKLSWYNNKDTKGFWQQSKFI